jgi:SAM-dependent methyltransferase
MQFIKIIFRPYKFLRLFYKAFKPITDIPKIKRATLKKVLVKYSAESLKIMNSKTLDLGSGQNPQNPFFAATVFGIDLSSNIEKKIYQADLAIEKIPFDDNYFDYLTAYDFLEHIPRVIYSPNRRFAFVEVMNEAWRVLKPGGLFLSHTPVYPYSSLFRDPTHVNLIACDTFQLYFDSENRMAKMYGFVGAFEIIHEYIREPYLISILKKIEVAN